MLEIHRLFPKAFALAFSVLLTACGGAGEDDSTSSAAQSNSFGVDQAALSQEPNAPIATGDTATDGFNWFNFRRQQAGLPALTRNSLIANAAQGHSDYQKINDTITHTQTAGKPGFTGATPDDRMEAAGYNFITPFAFGEVISATADPSGFRSAESLITAIYHRFAIMEPQFKEAGSGTATVPNGYTYFTTNFASSDGLGAGLKRGGLITYPFADQVRVPTVFYSDQEVPDPVPGQNAVGYPVSIHANISSRVAVQSFTLQPRGGAPLPVRLLSNGNDSQTPRSTAAIVPLSTLRSGTTYDAQFIGSIDGIAVNRSWSFTTR